MKWIKKFEELSPELIRRAGKGLIEKGHEQKGLSIFDKSYSDKFSLWAFKHDDSLGWEEVFIGDKKKSVPKPLDFFYKKSELSFYPIYSDYEYKSKEMNVDNLIDDWLDNECSLSFNIDFCFTPTKEALESCGEYLEVDQDLYFFSLNFEIHDKIISLDEKKRNKLNNESTYLQEYFNNYKKEPVITIYTPRNSFYYGIFSNRRDAVRFKNTILPKVIEEHSGEIMDLISILNLKSDIAESLLEFYKKVSVNFLYRSEFSGGTSSARNIYRINKGKDIRS